MWVILAATISTPCWGSPCDSVNRNLTTQRKATLEPVIAKQLGVRSAKVLESFREDGWSIIYVGTSRADDAFLFYSNNPMTNRYVTLWAGVARKNEEGKIRNWVLQNAKGIPHRLANCFAWHVTNDPRFRNW